MSFAFVSFLVPQVITVEYTEARREPSNYQCMVPMITSRALFSSLLPRTRSNNKNKEVRVKINYFPALLFTRLLLEEILLPSKNQIESWGWNNACPWLSREHHFRTGEDKSKWITAERE